MIIGGEGGKKCRGKSQDWWGLTLCKLELEREVCCHDAVVNSKAIGGRQVAAGVVGGAVDVDVQVLVHRSDGQVCAHGGEKLHVLVVPGSAHGHEVVRLEDC